MSINLDHMREFVIFSQSLNYTVASKELFIAQPTLIQHVAKLERDLGFELVSHDHNPRLTDAGVVFRAEAERILNDLESVISRCKVKGDRKPENVRIASVPACIEGSFFDSEQARTSGIRPVLTSIDADMYDPFQALDDDIVDFSVAVGGDASMAIFDDLEDRTYGFIPLPSQTCNVNMSYDHPLASRKGVSIEDLSEYTLVECSTKFYMRNSKDSERVLKAKGVRSGFVYVPAESANTLLKSSHAYIYVIASRSETISRIVNRDDDIVAVPLDDESLRFHPYAIYRLDNPNPHVHEYANLWKRHRTEIGASGC